jgi:hypothetical protein
MKFQRCTWIFLFCYITTIRFNAFARSNTYEQYIRAISLLSVNETNLFSEYDVCENKTFELFHCGPSMLRRISLDYPAVWDPSSALNSVDCSYEIIRHFKWGYNQRLDRLNFNLTLIQSDCKSSFNQSMGGSSFDVKALTEDGYFISCDIIDEFNNNYTILCDIPNANR